MLRQTRTLHQLEVGQVRKIRAMDASLSFLTLVRFGSLSEGMDLVAPM